MRLWRKSQKRGTSSEIQDEALRRAIQRARHQLHLERKSAQARRQAEQAEAERRAREDAVNAAKHANRGQ